MALTYPSFVSEIATITAITSSVLVNGDNNFQGVMPMIIDQAEGMLWRDLDLPAARVTDVSVTCSSGVRFVILSTAPGTLLAIEALSILTPAGAALNNSTLVPLIPTSQAVIEAIFPSQVSSMSGVPQYFARLSDSVIIFGPQPDQPYQTAVTATIRPTALSASNSSTWLTQNVPEMMIAAGMVAAAGYMRDFGAQSDNPQMAQSWKGQYDYLLKSMSVDSLRMKFQSQQWTSEIPNPLAPRV